MAEAQITLPIHDLPADATNAEALAWVARMRRIVDRWYDLPDASSRSMTTELRKELRDELDTMERMVRDNMALPEWA
jgi:hypothetical protein